ncbi:DUF5050 domain-containing protein [Haloimpatiens sp. FM7330]|uniref:DUF5050 domain-containing protein n=1 Tax=Haloimpatiens sp. FM7330 TaxID=3298610 RepID=UPI00362ED96D
MSNKSITKAVCLSAICAVLSVPFVSVVNTTNVQAATMERIGEENRYLTACRLAKETFKTSNAVVLVSGKGYADAVCAAPFAKNLNAPILLTSGNRLENQVGKTIRELGARTVYIIGGKGSISSQIESSLRSNYGIYVKRIAGKSRYDTSVLIANEVLRKSGNRTVLLANGQVGYPDAISAASIAANMGYPLLITDTKKVPTCIKNLIKTKSLNVLAVGGKGIITDSALKSVGGKRIAAGRDRFDTNIKLLNYFKNKISFDKIYVACGGADRKSQFADALAASGAAAKTNSPVVLSGLGAGTSQIESANRFIRSNMKKSTIIKIVGGKAVIKPQLEQELNRIISGEGQIGIGTELPYDKKFTVIGDKAYSMNYFIRHSSKINSDLKNGTGLIFYCYKEGRNSRILNPNTNEFLTEEELMKECGKTVHFYDTYTEKTYVYNGNVFKLQNVGTQSTNSNLSISEMGDRKIVGVKLFSNVKQHIAGAKYFQIKGSPYIKYIDGSNEINCVLSRDLDNRFKTEVYLLNYDKKVIAKGVLDITSFLSTSGTSRKIDFDLVDEKTNNAAGNIINGGMALQSGSYIYYNNTGDGNKLYKMALDGSYNRAISENDARYINVFDDTLIYSNYKDDFKLYKVKNDGTKPEKICNDKATYVNVVGDYIYYSNHSNGGKIYKIKITRTEKGPSFGSSQLVCSDECEYLNVVGNTIYYSNYGDGHKLYAVNTNGTGRIKLSNESCNYVNVYGSYIYYITDSGQLKRIGTDGTVPSHNILASKVSSLNAMGDYVYYTNLSDGGKIYRVSKRDFRCEKVCNDSAEALNITGNFVSVGKNSINVTGENIFYSKSSKLYRYDLKNAIRTGSKNGSAVKKPNYTLKVKKVYDGQKTIDMNDINRSQKYIDDKYLPEKITVLMSDDTVRELVVVWDRDKVSQGSGTRTYSGKVIGYGATAKFKLNLVSKDIDPHSVAIENSADTSDTMTVRGLGSGDVIKVYRNTDSGTSAAASGTANSSGVATINLGTSVLDNDGGYIYITVTSSGNSESKPVRINYNGAGPKQPSTFHAKDNDSSNHGVDGRDMALTWATPSSDVVKQYVYVVKDNPDNATLDYRRSTPLATIYDNRTTHWTGNYDLDKDSQGFKLSSGRYRAFIVFEDAKGRKSKPKYYNFNINSEGTNDVSVYGVSFDDNSITMVIGDTKTPEVKIRPVNATNQNYTLESYNKNIVAVEGHQIRALASGTTSIRVITEDGSHYDTCTITVGLPSVTDVTQVHIDRNSLNINAGDEVQLNVNCKPDNVQNPNIIWTSSDDDVVKVDSTGKIKALKSGTVTIKAKADGTHVYDTCTVHVNGGYVPVTSVDISGSLSLVVGHTKKLNVSVNPSDATNKDVTWVSSNREVAEVDQDGNVTAKKAGSATIVVTTKDKGKYDVCTVVVTNK